MNRFFKNTLAKLRHHPILEVSAMSGAAMLLVLAAVFISEGGMSRVNHVLAMYGITAESQTGCVFPCNNTAYSLQALIPMQGGVPVSTVQPGTNVDWIWNAGAYGANNFNPACKGRIMGYWYDCWVTLGSPPSSLGTPGSCSPGWTESGGCAQEACAAYDKFGCAGYYCASYYPDIVHPATGCGNADIYFGWSTYGASGGYPPNYASPGYAGNIPGTLVMAAPSTPGNYTYYLCSAFLIWYAPAGAGQGCLGTTLTVASPPPTCTLSPASQSITQGNPASFTYSTSNATAVSYRVDGGGATTPAGNPFSVSGLAAGTHGVIMTVTGPGGNATCGSASNVVVTAPAAPSCTLTKLSDNTTGNYSYGTFSYTTAGAVSATYRIDGGAVVTPPNNPFNVTGLGAGTHSVIMTVTNSVSATATCGTAGNLTTSAIGAPTVSITAGGASSVTVPVNGTTALAWSTSNATPGAASVTAPSSSGTATNFSAITSGTANMWYSANFLIGNGYIYRLGGNNGTSYTISAGKAPLSSDLTNNANWVLSTLNLPATFVSFSKPVVLNNTVYLFGGLKSDGSAWTNNICTVPLASVETNVAWNCAAGTMAGAYALSDVVIIGDYLYRFGGYNPSAGGGQSSVQRARVASPTSWTNFPSVLPQAIYGPGVAVVGNYVYVFGGYHSTNGVQSTIYRALITSDLTVPSSWASAGSLPAATYVPGIAVDSTYVYVIGGYSSTGASMSTIQRSSIANLAAGAPAWTNVASLPTSMYHAQPLMVDSKLYIMGGYSTAPTASYVNKIFVVPFNNGRAYTSPAMSPWLNDGGTNYAVTWPITVPSVAYTLSATNAVGTSNVVATVNKPDLCTNAPFTGIQNPLPGGVSAIGTTCSCIAAGTTWNGSSCIVVTPVVSSFFGPARVRKGNTAVLTYTVTNPPATCTVVGNNGFSSTTGPFNGVQSPPVTTSAINTNTTFTLTCGSVSTSLTVGITPVFQEQ